MSLWKGFQLLQVLNVHHSTVETRGLKNVFLIPKSFKFYAIKKN